ncbi:MAG: glycosyltransferase 87 family protein [Jatrophihabitantaceae bacterium]
MVCRSLRRPSAHARSERLPRRGVRAPSRCLALLAAAVELARRLVGQHTASPLIVPLVTAIAIWCEPVFATLHFGQINLLIMVLVLWDFSRAPDARGRGVALGLATALKVTPAIFVVYLLLIRRFRFAATAIGAFTCLAVVSIAVRPHDTVRYWTSLVFDTRRVGNLANPANQSLRGVLVRAAHQLNLGFTATAMIAVAAVLGLACSARAYRQRGEAWGLCAAAVTGLLVSPVSWSHHWVWCVPIAVLFVTASPAASWRTRGILGVACLVFVSYRVSAMVPSHQLRNLHMSPVAQLDAVPYVLFGVLFLALAALRRSP